MAEQYMSGRRGPDVRSDCFIAIEPRDRGGLEIELKSKVEALFGESIRGLIAEEAAFFSLEHARVTVEDSGALPFVIAARFEAALKRLRPDEKREFLLPARDLPPPSERDRFRRSRLYLPGNEPKFFVNAALHEPDGVILDLEDSVAPEVKDDARILVRNALRAVDFLRAERMVRINQLPLGMDDLRAVVPHGVDVILVPKCETADHVLAVAGEAQAALEAGGIERPLFLMPIIESAKGAINAYEIATAAESVVALAVGLEDYTADIGVVRTEEGRESFWMRAQVVNAARAAGVQPIDTVYSDVANEEGLRASVREARSLGFDGKGCIHPRQIRVVHEAFAPSEAEIERAGRIVRAYHEARARGLGVVSLGSKMIDPPVVKRAQRTIDLAVRSGLLSSRWMEEENNG